MHPTRSLVFCCLAFVALAVFNGEALATNYAAVGTCTPPNPPTHVYTTIQAAVTASAPATVIEICPGNYPEQVSIGKKLTLEGVVSGTQDAAVILPPSTGMVANASDVDDSHPIAAQILVHDTFSALVTIANLTVDGLGNQIAGCGPDLQGILFQNASGTVDHDAVRNQVPGDVLNGCQSGESIFVQTGSGFTSKVTVENSSVHNYNKNGITGNDPNTKLTVTGNYVQGSGFFACSPSCPIAAQNGIQLGFGATGKISANTVIDNIYGDPTAAAAADILLFDSAGSSAITIATNVVGNSQIPIALFTDTAGEGDGVTVMTNKIFGASTYDAIDVCTNGNTVTGNTIFNSAESAVHLDASCGSTGNSNSVTGNTMLESACAGILADSGTTGNNTSPDTYYTVPFEVTSSTASCTSPGEAKRFKTAHKFIPSR
jgi:hypothetical protein